MTLREIRCVLVVVPIERVARGGVRDRSADEDDERDREDPEHARVGLGGDLVAQLGEEDDGGDTDIGEGGEDGRVVLTESGQIPQRFRGNGARAAVENGGDRGVDTQEAAIPAIHSIDTSHRKRSHREKKETSR